MPDAERDDRKRASTATFMVAPGLIR